MNPEYYTQVVVETYNLLQIGATIMYEDMDYILAKYLQYYRKEIDDYERQQMKNK